MKTFISNKNPPWANLPRLLSGLKFCGKMNELFELKIKKTKILLNQLFKRRIIFKYNNLLAEIRSLIFIRVFKICKKFQKLLDYCQGKSLN